MIAGLVDRMQLLLASDLTEVAGPGGSSPPETKTATTVQACLALDRRSLRPGEMRGRLFSLRGGGFRVLWSLDRPQSERKDFADWLSGFPELLIGAFSQAEFQRKLEFRFDSPGSANFLGEKRPVTRLPIAFRPERRRWEVRWAWGERP